jgi:ADP-ribosylglycohydrolase
MNMNLTDYTKKDYSSSPKTASKRVLPTKIPEIHIKRGTLQDRALGSLAGVMIGDLLGQPFEMKKAEDVRKACNNAQTITDVAPILVKGTPTDDTAMTVDLADSIREKKSIDTYDIAKKWLQWYVEDGAGIGGLTRDVLNIFAVVDGKAMWSIQEIAESVWKKTNETRAGNGALMRTAPIGIWFHADNYSRSAVAAEVASLTHADLRCQYACMMYCDVIAHLLHGNVDVDKFILTKKYSEILLKVEDAALIADFANLNFEKEAGFTFTALTAALNAIHNAKTFEEGILAVLRGGGDTDTNCAIAGGLLGAKFGFSAIPETWRARLLKFPEHMARIVEFVKLIV